MQAVEVRKPGSLRVHEVETPEPGPGEVLIAVELVGICGTDIHMIDGHFPSARYPARPGHEVTGIIAGSTPGSVLTPGTRVCIDPAVPCLRCGTCRAGRPNLCRDRKAYGVSLPGGAADFLIVPERSCYPVSQQVQPEKAVLCEPLACVIHAIDRVPGSPAVERAVVYGAGTMGLLAVQVLDHLGAARVDVVEPNEARHTLATKVATGQVSSAADAFDNPEWDLVIDASGVPGAIADGIRRVRAGGTFVQLGVAPNGATVPVEPFAVFARELTVVGSMTTWHSFDRAVAYLERGVIDVSGFTGEPISLPEYARAVEIARCGSEVKTVVRPG